MNFVRPPWWLRMLLDRRAWWYRPGRKPVVYLTFDDGPHPEETPFVLEQLRLYDAKATFFCIGQNVRKFPAVYAQILQAGHTTANHTEHHLNGRTCTVARYLQDIEAAEDVITATLFRPPYGMIRPRAARAIRRKGMQLVMWDVLTWDFDTRLTPDACLAKAIKYVRPGSIVVFHDSTKAAPRLRVALPGLLAHIAAQGWAMESLPAQ